MLGKRSLFRANEREVATIILQVSRALAAAHARGVLHLNIKPRNVHLLRETGEVMVRDFQVTTKTKSRPALTPMWSSPEQIKSHMEDDASWRGCIDAKSDVFSIGLLLHYLLSGRVPQPEMCTNELIGKRALYMGPFINGPMFPGASERLRTIGQQCIDNDPLCRPSSEQLVERLTQHLGLDARGGGLTLSFDTRLHRFDPTAFDALIAQTLGPSTAVTIEERSNIDGAGPAFIRINGSAPEDLVAVAEAFYERIWHTVILATEGQALRRAGAPDLATALLRRLDRLADAWSGAAINHPAVTAMLVEQATAHMQRGHDSVRRIEELSVQVRKERNARRALMELLAGLFAPGTLHAWAGHHFDSTVVDALPGPTASHADVATELVAILERVGLVNRELFALLAERAPAIAKTVDLAASLWGLR